MYSYMIQGEMHIYILLTQHAGEVAEGVEASVGYGVYNSKTLVSANRQPEAETFILSHCCLSQPPQALRISDDTLPSQPAPTGTN